MEKEKIISLLQELKKINSEIALFDKFKNSKTYLIKKYSQLYQTVLGEKLIEDSPIFYGLDENSGNDEINITISLLISYLKD